MMDKASFLVRYGGIFEHSPWIAKQVWDQGSHSDSARGLNAAFSDVIRSVNRKQQLALLRAHPQLASAIASGEELTAESRGEQHGAGLDQCSAAEFEEFEYLNSTYSDNCGFPFIFAVKGLGREQILESFRTRLANAPEEEFIEALEQVTRIGKFRLRELTEKTGSES
jgi:2-oxo-4-hydroxy-4-carboxy-5-ureidoimidazoline decarboxylase